MKRKAKETVAIISRESNERTLDIRLLEDELIRRGVKTETLCRLLTKERSLKSLGYIGHIFHQMLAIARADVVVLDTYCIPVSMLPHRKNLKVIQMWHALSAIKKFGWQTVGKEDGSSERTARIMKMHKGYDYVLCASDITAKFFCEAFRAGKEKIVKIGLPRIDYIRSVSAGDAAARKRADIFGTYPKLSRNAAEGKQERKIVLYAPTFRRGLAVDVEGLAKALDPDKYWLVVKMHPIDRDSSERVEAENVIYDETFRSYDWLSAADIVISDYSSFVVESALADLPLYLYTFDIDTYGRTTGLNIDFSSEPISKYVFTGARDLAAALEEPYDFEALTQFRDRYIDVDTANCTGQLADFIQKLFGEKNQ